MRVIFQIAILILSIALIDSSVYNSVQGTISKYWNGIVNAVKDTLRSRDVPKNDKNFKVHPNKIPISDIQVTKNGKIPKAIIRIFKAHDDDDKDSMTDKVKHARKSLRDIVGSNRWKALDKSKEERYHMDPVLNNVRRQNNGLRRLGDESETSISSSSSLEIKNWKKEFQENYLKKKIEAINSTQPHGDVVNMVAARPWGVKCGDPNQHDMPWGTCMLPAECEPEYRIYRGDFLCGRSTFICCAIELTNYDMYQAFDISFADPDFSTDSEDRRDKRGSSERKRRKRAKAKNRRKKDRMKRIKHIKKNIKKIINEIRKILNREYRNGTQQKKRMTKQLKKFVKDLKKKYKKDRKTVKGLHDTELVKMDAALLKKIREVRDVNREFMANATFRDIIVTGFINKQGARMLVQAYPELLPFFMDSTRRSENQPQKKKGDVDYDVEYGMLYY